MGISACVCMRAHLQTHTHHILLEDWKLAFSIKHTSQNLPVFRSVFNGIFTRKVMGGTTRLVSSCESSCGSTVPDADGKLRLPTVGWGPRPHILKGQHSNQWVLAIPPRHLVLQQQIRHEWSFKQGLAFNFLAPSGKCTACT